MLAYQTNEFDFSNKVLRIFLLSFVLFLPLRGYGVLYLGLPPSILYPLTGIILIGLSFYGFLYTSYQNHVGFVYFKNLILLNFLSGISFVVVTFLLTFSISLDVAYIFFAPYFIFLLLKIPNQYLYYVVIAISLGLSYSIISLFLSLDFSGQRENAYIAIVEYNKLLRPDLELGVSSSGGSSFRLGGVTGSYHDSANILGMTVAFLYSRYLLWGKPIDIFICVFSLIALALTVSGANIAILLVTIFLISLMILCKYKVLRLYLIIFFSICILFYFLDELTVIRDIFNRLSSASDNEALFHALSWKMMLTDSFWMGHGYETQNYYIDNEVALLKFVLQFGFIRALILFSLMLYPIAIFASNPYKLIRSLPYVAALFFGFFSLLHYGSLFRVTNIVVYLIFYSMFIQHILTTKNTK